MREFQSAAVASRAEGRGLVVLTNSDRGLGACVEILRDVLGDDFSYPIRSVLERALTWRERRAESLVVPAACARVSMQEI